MMVKKILPDVQKFKGMIREYEEELVWANYGVRVKDIYHLRLGFYQGDVFTESPKIERDVMPVLNQLKDKKPTVISLALDPEGSGPDTHYKVLQTIANAVRLWNKEADLSNLKFGATGMYGIDLIFLNQILLYLSHLIQCPYLIQPL